MAQSPLTDLVSFYDDWSPSWTPIDFFRSASRSSGTAQAATNTEPAAANTDPAATNRKMSVAEFLTILTGLLTATPTPAEFVADVQPKSEPAPTPLPSAPFGAPGESVIEHPLGKKKSPAVKHYPMPPRFPTTTEPNDWDTPEDVVEKEAYRIKMARAEKFRYTQNIVNVFAFCAFCYLLFFRG